METFKPLDETTPEERQGVTNLRLFHPAVTPKPDDISGSSLLEHDGSFSIRGDGYYHNFRSEDGRCQSSERHLDWDYVSRPENRIEYRFGIFPRRVYIIPIRRDQLVVDIQRKELRLRCDVPAKP